MTLDAPPTLARSRTSPRTYGSIARVGPWWVIGRLEPNVCIRLKQLFPRVRKADPPPYRFPSDPAIDVDLDWFLQRYPLEISADDASALRLGRRAFETRMADAERLLSGGYRPPVFAGVRPPHAPRPHQAAAAQLLGLYGGLLVGDDVGEGKTYTAMVASLLEGALPAVMVCDPHLQVQWAEAFAEFTTLTTHQVRQTTPYALPPADVRIFRWTQLLGWADMFEAMGVGLVAFDECQELRTGTSSGRGVAAGRLAAAARYRLGLTATPIYGYGVEIWEVMRYLRPEVLGERGEFAREWAPSGRITNPVALGAYLREQHAMVRKRKLVDRVNTMVKEVAHDEASLASIEEVAHALAVTATTGTFTERGQAVRELDLRLRMQTGIAKAPWVADGVRILAESGVSLILAGWHRDVYDIWLERLADLKPAMYTGSETPKRKAEEKARFLAGDTNILILSLRSGRGLNGLQTRSRFVVVGELDWSPQVHHQIVGRLDREGSVLDGTDELIDVLYLVADDGSDPPMMEMLGLKASESAAIIDPDLGVRVRVSDEAKFAALIGRYLQDRQLPRSSSPQGDSAKGMAA